MSPLGKTLLRGLHGLQGTASLERRLRRAVQAGDEHPTRWRERLGTPSEPRPDGPLLWVHLHGADEIEKLIGLHRHLVSEREDLNLLITTSMYEDTPMLRDGLIHQFAPLSTLEPVKSFLQHWRPDVLLWLDPMPDPVMLSEAHDAGVACFWLNAHVGNELKHPRRWIPGGKRAFLGAFDRIFAEDPQAMADLRRLGVATDQIEATGPLQMQVVPPSCNMEERDRLAATLEARPVWLASRLQEDEEQAVVAAHRQLVRKSHRLLLMIEPADPKRGIGLADALEADGWNVATRSRGQDPARDAQIFVADLPDEAGLWMHLAPITFAGGSLSGVHCLNPLKPAALGSVVLYGGQTDRHRQAFRRLASAGAARHAADADKLVFEVERLLSPERAAQMAMAAWDVTTSGAQVSDLVRDHVLAALDEKGV